MQAEEQQQRGRPQLRRVLPQSPKLLLSWQPDWRLGQAVRQCCSLRSRLPHACGRHVCCSQRRLGRRRRWNSSLTNCRFCGSHCLLCR